MKAIRKHLKLIVIILCVPLLTQCFSIYKSANVSLYDAVQSNSKVKITKTNGEKQRFSKIVLSDDENFYGKKFTNSKGGILIDTNNIKKVQVKDLTASTIINITSPIVVIGIILLPEIIRTGGFPVY